MKHIQDHITYWLCPCCLFAAEYGEQCDCEPHEGNFYVPPSDPHPHGLLGFLDVPEGWHFAMGVLESGHWCSEDDRESGDCDCGQRDFDKSQCDGCGSRLAGNRYAFTAILWGED